MDRVAVKKALVDSHREARRRAREHEARAKDAREAATHEEAKPENDKDTRALEASYCRRAGGVRELEGLIKMANGMELFDFEGEGDPGVRRRHARRRGRGPHDVLRRPPIGGGILLANGGPRRRSSRRPRRSDGAARQVAGDVIEMRAQTLRGPGPLREMTIFEVVASPRDGEETRTLRALLPPHRRLVPPLPVRRPVHRPSLAKGQRRRRLERERRQRVRSRRGGRGPSTLQGEDVVVCLRATSSRSRTRR